MITCVAIVTHAPIYLSSFSIPEDEYLRQQSLVHMALDAIDDRISSGALATADGRPDAYLGSLGGGDVFTKVYGYVTNGSARILIVDSSKGSLKEDQVRSAFKEIHSSYVDAISNPFYDPSSLQLTSKRFSSQLTNIVQGVNAAAAATGSATTKVAGPI